MILSYITNTYSITPAPVKTETGNVMFESKPELILPAEGNLNPAIVNPANVNTETGNTDTGNGLKENESYEMKYKLLMQKIEKERFERELLADTR